MVVALLDLLALAPIGAALVVAALVVVVLVVRDRVLVLVAEGAK